MSVWKHLWNDEAGFTVSTELALLATMVVIGLIVGIDTLRVAVVQEFGDLGMALGELNQSYSYPGVACPVGAAVGSDYADQTDLCEGADTADAPPGCIVVGPSQGMEADDEGDAVQDNEAGSVAN